MNEINVTIRYMGEKHTYPTQDDVILEDLLQQIAQRSNMPERHDWIVTKAGGDTALNLGATLAANNIVDGDILDLALPTKGG